MVRGARASLYVARLHRRCDRAHHGAAIISSCDYFAATESHLKRHRKPAAFYSDKHGIFRVAREGATGRSHGVTQFGRALAALNIDIICANTPQAKGRVERMNKTLQDRLVKELRL